MSNPYAVALSTRVKLSSLGTLYKNFNTSSNSSSSKSDQIFFLGALYASIAGSELELSRHPNGSCGVWKNERSVKKRKPEKINKAEQIIQGDWGPLFLAIAVAMAGLPLAIIGEE